MKSNSIIIKVERAEAKKRNNGNMVIDVSFRQPEEHFLPDPRKSKMERPTTEKAFEEAV